MARGTRGKINRRRHLWPFFSRGYVLVVSSRVCLLREGALGSQLPLWEGRKGRWGRGNKAKVGPHPSTCHQHLTHLEPQNTERPSDRHTRLADPNCNCQFLLGPGWPLCLVRQPGSIPDTGLLENYHVHAPICRCICIGTIFSPAMRVRRRHSAAGEEEKTTGGEDGPPLKPNIIGLTIT